MNSNQSCSNELNALKKSNILQSKLFIYLSATSFLLYILNIWVSLLSIKFGLGGIYLGVLGEFSLLFAAVAFAILFLLRNEPINTQEDNKQLGELQQV